MAEKKLKFDGALADRLGDLRARVKESARQHKLLEKELSDLEQQVIDNVPKDSTGIAGKKWRIQTVPKTKLVVDTANDGWTLLWAHIKETGRFDFLQKRISETAVKETIESGKAVPGITSFTFTDVKVTGV